MENSGLLGRREDGSFYDRFRNRLMFPIHSESGKAIAFGGRALDPADEAKELKSASAGIYKKSAVLYNLHRAKEGIRRADRSVLVEGYMDAIGVFAAGGREGVARCGKSLTAQQVQALRKHSDKIVVNFDPDKAGANATEKYVNLLLDEGMHLRILELDGDLDPDEYCLERGAEAYRGKLDKAQTYFYWLADRARAKFDLRTAEGRVAGFQFLLPAIQRLPDKIARVAVANDVAGDLGGGAGGGFGKLVQNSDGPAGQEGRPRARAAAGGREDSAEPAGFRCRGVPRADSGTGASAGAGAVRHAAYIQGAVHFTRQRYGDLRGVARAAGGRRSRIISIRGAAR